MYNSIYPNYANAYLGLNKRQVTRKKDEEKNSQSSHSAENNSQQDNKQASRSSYFPNGEKVAIDYTKKKIGIEQVLSDFRNTTNAIGAPDIIKAEVASYLSLIESQSQKENPNPQIIQSNLKNASQILDEYITKTLKKPSKVVENWVDALFLQQIDYKAVSQQNATPEIIGTDSIVEIAEPEQEETTSQETTIPTTETITEEGRKKTTSNGIYVPSDPQLKRMFIQAKKYAAINNKEQALYSFQTTMDYAEELGDTQACAMIHFEEGKLYDDFNLLGDALYNYDRAAKQSNDNNIKAKAHLSMGKIYDNHVYHNPAVEHYSAAVSFAGQADNLKLQTQALSDLAQVHTDRYDKQNALMFMDMSSAIANETKDNKVKGITYSKNAKMSEKLGEKVRALDLYGNSSEAFSQISDNENLAKNYRSAAEIMLQYGNKAKAKKLLSKAYLLAQRTNNEYLKNLISKDLTRV